MWGCAHFTFVRHANLLGFQGYESRPRHQWQQQSLFEMKNLDIYFMWDKQKAVVASSSRQCQPTLIMHYCEKGEICLNFLKLHKGYVKSCVIRNKNTQKDQGGKKKHFYCQKFLQLWFIFVFALWKIRFYFFSRIQTQCKDISFVFCYNYDPPNK